MFKNKINKLILGFFIAGIWIGSIIFFLYSINAFNWRTQVVQQQQPKITTTAKHINNKKIKAIQASATDSHVKNLEKRGLISIPSLNIFEPVYNDAYSNYGLKYGANQVMNNHATSLTAFGINNVVIASHNYSNGKTGFSPLQQKINRNDPYIIDGLLHDNSWLNGKRVYLANHQGIYVYQITRQYAAKRTNRVPLNQSKSPKLTLLTCLEPNDSFRIVTEAKLINAYPWDKAPNKLINYFDTDVNSTNVQP